MIHTYIPYAPKEQVYNLGWAYNNFMNIIPNEEDWVCFLDHDATFTTKTWYTQLEDIIEANPEYGLFTCIVNRIGQRYQVPQNIDQNNHDMFYHRSVGKSFAKERYSTVTDITNVGSNLLSGVLMLVQKKTWNVIGGCPEGFLGVDNQIHKRCIQNNIKVGRMDGFYLYHWYRADGSEHVNEANKIHKPLKP